MSVFQKIGNTIARFMYGRNGMDQLNRTLFLTYFSIWIAEMILAATLKNLTVTRVLEGLLLALMLIIFYRMFSKNLPKRQAENQKWVNCVWRMKTRHSSAKARHADKEHKYFTCKNCKAICRVPTGKGRIEITCPKCGAKIQART
ncbi:MAG: hypothetical protein HFF90_09025 [Oscillibacter sp.]|nr:hypothetical protein [Oscillibacter sp.]